MSKTFQCPKCGYKTEKEERTNAVICPCGGYCHMLENSLPPAEDEIRLRKKNQSPEIIFRGEGWTEKFHE